MRFAVAHVDKEARFFYLTYAGGVVHVWSHDGQRVGRATLQGAAEDENGCHSLRWV